MFSHIKHSEQTYYHTKIIGTDSSIVHTQMNNVAHLTNCRVSAQTLQNDHSTEHKNKNRLIWLAVGCWNKHSTDQTNNCVLIKPHQKTATNTTITII